MNEEPQDIKDAICHHSSVLCHLVHATGASALTNNVTFAGPDGTAEFEFYVLVRKHKAGTKRAKRWNRVFLGYALAAFPAIMVEAIARYHGVPFWQSIMALSFTFLLALIATTNAIRYASKP